MIIFVFFFLSFANFLVNGCLLVAKCTAMLGPLLQKRKGLLVLEEMDNHRTPKLSPFLFIYFF